MKSRINDIYQKHLEWEIFDFPLKISQLRFEKQLSSLSDRCIITIWRDDIFSLKATISGITSTPQILEDLQKPVSGNIIIKEKIAGKSLDGIYSYEIQGCVIGNVRSIPLSIDPIEIQFEADLLIESFECSSIHSSRPEVFCDWNLCSKISVWFPRLTKRDIVTTKSKRREGIDQLPENKRVNSSGASRDFILIDVSGLKFIISKVPNEFGPDWSEKICFEYRKSFSDIPDEETRVAIRELVGFIFGSQLLNIGNTELSDKETVISQFAQSPWGNNAKYKCGKSALSPIDVLDTKDWYKAERIITDLLPKYLSLRKELKLSTSLWKYWIARDLSVGSNLPILSSAIEGLADLYFKAHPEIKPYYQNPVEYQKSIEEEVKAIATKLAAYPYKDIVINKINNAIYRGSNEKLEQFFDLLNLKIGSLERGAIKARNKMAHASKDITFEETELYISYTRAYEVLFHRIFLRILDYNGEYVDYCSGSCPSKRIEEAVS